MIEPSRYRPPFASERLLPITQHGFNGCRVSATWMAIAIATLGESTLNKDGTLKGVAGRRNDLDKMRDATGTPHLPGFNTSHVPAFCRAMGMPVPERFSGTFAQLWSNKDVAYTIAGNPSTLVGASKLEKLARERSWSGADHELLLTHARSAEQGLIFDPMMFQRASYKGDRIPKQEILQFMKSKELGVGGLLIAEEFPVGGWTQAAEARRRCARRIEDIVEEKQAVIKKLRAIIAKLQEDDPDVDIGAIEKAARLKALRDAVEALEALR